MAVVSLRFPGVRLQRAVKVRETILLVCVCVCVCATAILAKGSLSSSSPRGLLPSTAAADSRAVHHRRGSARGESPGKSYYVHGICALCCCCEAIDIGGLVMLMYDSRWVEARATYYYCR